MKIVEILGGIGNQMFDYAFALSLSKRTHRKVWMGLHEINLMNSHNGYELERVFNIKPSIIESILANLIYNKKIRAKYVFDIYEKENYEYDDEIFKVKHHRFFNHYIGYWQNENYFTNIESEIRRIFSFDTNKLSSKTKSIIEEIEKDSNSVSIHFRRGDYYSNPTTRSVHGDICSMDYYKKAIEIVKIKVPNAKFYIFSDDPQWVKDNFTLLNHATYVDWNRAIDSWQDIALMSHCKHHIIANSSFSWWGAWLATPYEGKIVIAPSQWLKASQSNAIVPKRWTMI